MPHRRAPPFVESEEKQTFNQICLRAPRVFGDVFCIPLCCALPADIAPFQKVISHGVCLKFWDAQILFLVRHLHLCTACDRYILSTRKAEKAAIGQIYSMFTFTLAETARCPVSLMIFSTSLKSV